MKKLLLAAMLMFGFATVLAAPQTVTLAVPGMYCEVCPITVKKSLEKVPGVSKVNVSFEAKEAVVTYDDAKTNVGKLTAATTAAAPPSPLSRVAPADCPRAPLIVNPCPYSSSRMRRTSSTSWCW